jgi:hypothetical protein
VETQDELEMLVQMIVVHTPQYSSILAGLHGGGKHRSKRSSSVGSGGLSSCVPQLTSLRPAGGQNNVSQIFFVPPAAPEIPAEREDTVNTDAQFLLPVADFDERVDSDPGLPNSLNV